VAVNIGASVDLAEGTGTRAMPALTTATTDVIVFSVIAEDAVVTNVTPSSSPTLTWTKRPDVGSASHTRNQIWTSSAVGVTSVTVTATPSVGGRNYRCRATAAGNVTGYGGTATSGTAQTASLARSGTNSAVFMNVGDWNTGAVGSPAWTPGGSTVASQQGSAATYILGLWSNSGSSGTASTGISSPSYTTPAFAALEVLGAGGLTGNVGRVTVTETARTITAAKTVAVGRVTVVESARTVARTKSVAVGRVSETSSARPASRQKAASTARVTVTEAARTVGRTKTYPAIGRVTSTESARTLGRLKTVPLGRVTETALAQVILKGGTSAPANRVTVTETARSLASAKAITLGRVTVTELARAAGRAKAAALARTVTTETARTLTRAKARTLVRVSSVETARAATAFKRQASGRVMEMASARTLTVQGPQPPSGAGQVWGVDMGLR